MSKRIFLLLVFSLLTVQGVLAQTAEYYLERIAVHNRLMESKLETPKLKCQFQGDLRRLAADLEDWKGTLFEEEDVTDVRERLDDHIHMLRASALTVSLDSDQNVSLDLLLREIENGAQNLTPDRFVQQPIRIPYNLPPRERGNSVDVNRWGVSGDNVAGWGGWLESCEPAGVDPWGPYFGRDINRNSGPFWW